MYTSFTGSARRPRKVDLSGRNAKLSSPTSLGAGQPPSSQTSSKTLANAQAERILRQQERLRPPAATAIQRSWRGHKARQEIRDAWRQEWDRREADASIAHYGNTETSAHREGDDMSVGQYQEAETSRYRDEEHCLRQLRLLVQFASSRNSQDVHRLCQFAQRFLHSPQILAPTSIWTYPLLRLSKLIIAALKHQEITELPAQSRNVLLQLLSGVAETIPKQLVSYSAQYFDALAEILSTSKSQTLLDTKAQQLFEAAVLALLQPDNPDSIAVYEGFTTSFLRVPDIPSLLGSLENIAQGVHFAPLCAAMNNLLSTSQGNSLFQIRSRDEMLWLLSYFIFFRRSSASEKRTVSDEAFNALFVDVISKLVSYLADEIGSRVDSSIISVSPPDTASAAPQMLATPLPDFVRREILTLASQENVSRLLTCVNMKADNNNSMSDSSEAYSHQASTLAIYALTLLRAFPRRGDEIRMWLYLGSTNELHHGRDEKEAPLPAIKYYFRAASQTKVYHMIKSDPRKAVDLLIPDAARRQTSATTIPNLHEQWQVILIFLELYPIVLKVMDDEEFLTGASSISDSQSWTRQSALTLESVKDLTIFLKNLAFAMYWNASEIAGSEEVESTESIAGYFRGASTATATTLRDDKPTKPGDVHVAGVPGMTVDYLKRMVTGLLRMIYERDSRRHFLSNDHWLMTQWFEMDRFIPAVVQEEEEKHKIQESYGEDPDDEQTDEEERHDYLIGTQRTQQVRNIERLKRQQKKASRKRYLESVTPRLEILQNMPFFIPFSTRVQIFRHFVQLDQLRRRGTADADMWRFAMMNSGRGEMGKHRARVHRESIFDDAFDQYYDLGEGLKEPIQISFVDKFDTVEEGIDGGGVTKEFLTSVTNEAFSSRNGLDLFIENDQHLLYPNPMALDERKELLSQAEIVQGSLEWNDNMRDLLRRFEFMGRIIGKCLYEGILVDVHFAGFFLLKWALTGGSRSASKESGYRANLNDLRDLDEGLYQGLLQLKNYPGNVEDFSLNFEVTDTLFYREPQTYDQSLQKPVTRELRPGGSQIPVTNENRLVYISFIARHRLQVQPFPQTSAFLKGLGTIISPSWLSMFNQNELQTLVGGDSSEIDIADLRQNTQYGGLYQVGDDGQEHPSVQLFWQAMQSFADEDRRKVLKFVTSTPRAPLLGFSMLNPRFSIRDSGNDQTRLPTTSTCVNLLKLPVYNDGKTLRDRLLYSVNAGAGFNLS
ncbi:MAG: hypothetical protein LQ351_001813 [Letrouitia transgressa]|nr:MAG: hypothetical protein LQ351_001813 [Letrouitia transgressa]